ncbi:MAG: zinc ribbon domain-containing protein [Chloroflexota bacterium]|nr:zinc ribbon domain-containing protein [Chloroflexota bacterium]
MPIYEYYCADCKTKFEVLRRMSEADDPIACPHCGGISTSRTISVFAAVSKGSSGESKPIGGSSPCSTCTATTCALCHLKR